MNKKSVDVKLCTGLCVILLLLTMLLSGCVTIRGSGDLGVVIERASGSVHIINTSNRHSISQVSGLGDLSHASVVFSRDQRFAFIFARDGGLSKLDLLTGKLIKRIVQSGNSIGGAISQDGRLIAVANYKPGGVKVFRSDDLSLVADIPAYYGTANKRSKVVGLVDAPAQKFVFSLYDAGQVWVADFSQIDDKASLQNSSERIKITKYPGIGSLPYDALISNDGRYYIVGLYGESGLALLDLWHPELGVRRILKNYGAGKRKLPVFKMPHLEAWAMAGSSAFLPALGRHEVLVVSQNNWKLKKRIATHGQPVFVMARPDGRFVWVNYAFPNNDVVEVIDTVSLKVVKSLKPGKAIMHMEFSPRGEHIWISARDDNQVSVYDTNTYQLIAKLAMQKPSGIFLTARAHRTGL